MKDILMHAKLINS